MKERQIQRRLVFFTFIVLFLSALPSCKDKENIDYVAKVQDSYLSHEQLNRSIPLNASTEDSTKLANIFIDNWVRKRVVLSQAELNLTDYEKDVDEELERYKSDLIIYKFERELIKQKLDTLIPNEEIDNYYLENIEMFKLKDYAIQVVYVSHPSNFENEKELKELVKSYTSKDSLELSVFCEAPDFECFQRKGEWIYLKDLLSEIPLTIYNEERFLKKDKFVDFEEGNRRYLLKVIDFKLKDSYSPVDLETRNIKSIILNSRKIKLLEKMREDLFQKALNNGEIEINK